MKPHLSKLILLLNFSLILQSNLALGLGSEDGKISCPQFVLSCNENNSQACEGYVACANTFCILNLPKSNCQLLNSKAQTQYYSSGLKSTDEFEKKLRKLISSPDSKWPSKNKWNNIEEIQSACLIEHELAHIKDFGSKGGYDFLKSEVIGHSVERSCLIRNFAYYCKGKNTRFSKSDCSYLAEQWVLALAPSHIIHCHKSHSNFSSDQCIRVCKEKLLKFSFSESFGFGNLYKNPKFFELHKSFVDERCRSDEVAYGPKTLKSSQKSEIKKVQKIVK
jgi:hypothetical protein